MQLSVRLGVTSLAQNVVLNSILVYFNCTHVLAAVPRLYRANNKVLCTIRELYIISVSLYRGGTV